MAVDAELIRLTATEVVTRLKERELSPLELVEASISRIEQIDGTVNALPIRCFERAWEQAKKLESHEKSLKDKPKSLLGLPVAIKDYNDVSGVRTTHGSTIFAENVAQESDYTVTSLENNDAIPLGKSNVPEFAGANTFNRVFGRTLNPWDTRLSVGGSSGGSAAALATGMVWLATGNDLGGSLRTPASFCSVVGLRPSPGRIAQGPRPTPFDTLWVEGPMGRTVSDVALMLDAQVGQHVGDPLSLPLPATEFSEAVRTPKAPKRVAFSPDLGIVPVEKEVAEVCAKAAQRFADLGAEVEETSPDFSSATHTFQTLRALLFSSLRGPLLEEQRDSIAPEIVWNIEKGLNLTGEEIALAERQRGVLYQEVVDFFSTYDLLVCPATTVTPFPVDKRYVDEIAGQQLNTYIDWISITFAITLTSCPAVSVPCGYTTSELPVGLQMVGPPRGEADLLASAFLFEQSNGTFERTPVDPKIRT